MQKGILFSKVGLPDNPETITGDDETIESLLVDYKKDIYRSRLAIDAIDADNIKTSQGLSTLESLTGIQQLLDSSELQDGDIVLTSELLSSLSAGLGYELDIDDTNTIETLKETTEGFFADIVNAMGRVAVRSIRAVSTFYMVIKTRQYRLGKLAKKLNKKLQNVTEGNVKGKYVYSGVASNWFTDPENCVKTTIRFANLRIVSENVIGVLQNLVDAEDTSEMFTKFKDAFEGYAHVDPDHGEAERKILKDYANLERDGVVTLSVPGPGKTSHRFVIVSLLMDKINSGIYKEASTLLIGKGLAKIGPRLDTTKAGKFLAKKVLKKAFKFNIPKKAMKKVTMSTFFKYSGQATSRVGGILEGVTFGTTLTPVFWVGSVMMMDFIVYSTQLAKNELSRLPLVPLSIKQCNTVLSAVSHMANHPLSLKGLSGSLAKIEKRIYKTTSSENVTLEERTASTMLSSVLGQTNTLMSTVYKNSVYSADAAITYALKSTKLHIENPSSPELTSEHKDLSEIIDKVLQVLESPQLAN